MVTVTGEGVPNVALAVTQIETQRTTQALTDSDGRFRLTGLPPGRYRVEAQAPGYRSYVLEDVTLTTVRPAQIAIALETGAAGETVQATAAGTQIGAENGEIVMGLGARQIRELPIRDRNFQELIGLLPGITPPETSTPILLDPQRNRIFNTNGQSYIANSWNMDGFYQNEPTSHTSIFISPVESLDETKVVTGSYEPSSRWSGGSIVNPITRSGANEFHGSAYWFNSIDEFRNRDFFETDAIPEGQFRWNQFGGNIGGPIAPDRVFFFGTYEGSYLHWDRPRLATTPTAAMRQGDFSEIPNLTLFDPATGGASGAGRTPFTNNAIPTSRLNPITQQLLPFFPEANQPGIENNLLAYAPLRNDNHRTGGRVDARIGSNSSLFLNYRYGKYFVSDASPLGNVLGNDAEGRLRTHNAYLGFNHIFGSQLVTEARLGYNRYRNFLDPVNAQNPLAGLPLGNLGGERLPTFQFGTMTSIGAREGLPARMVDNTYQVGNNWSWTTGRHTVVFGADVHHFRVDGYRGLGLMPGGFGFSPGTAYTFGFGATSSPDAALNPGSGASEFASFLLGMPATSITAVEAMQPAYRRTFYSGFIGDTWRATNRLSLNAGLRYDVFSPVRAAHEGGIGNYNPADNTLRIGGLGGVNRYAGVRWDANNVAPRFGMAYRLGNRSAIRAGYAMSYFPTTIGFAAGGPYPAVVSSQLGLDGVYAPGGALFTGPPPELGDLSAGTITPPGTQPLVFLSEAPRTPVVHSYNVTYQTELPGALTMDVGYVGTLGRRLPYYRQWNAAMPGTGMAGIPLLEEFGRGASTIHADTGANNNYNALQASARKRFAFGLSGSASYTYSRTLDEVSGQDFLLYNFDRRRNYGPADFDRTHVFAASHVWDLSIQNAGWLTRLLTDWELTGTLQWVSGLPFTPVAGSLECCPGNNLVTADVTGDVNFSGSTPGDIGAGLYFDTNPFSMPAPGTFGNVGRNAFRGPGFFNYNLGLFRSFSFSEQRRLEFRGELYNVTNSAQFANPVANLNSPNFGRIVATRTNAWGTDSFGSGRQLNLGVRLIF
ncbi:MAG: TonB-dependent receptor [Bryobacteraceae bacterium]|nr:TonB-dependent receptor [Bryobacteraceae bacterium]